MLQDRFVKITLVVIAALLAANLLRPSERSPILLESTAQAQDARPMSGPPGMPVSVTPIGGFRVSDVKDIIPVGDGKSFVVANPHGFNVYRVDDAYANRR